MVAASGNPYVPASNMTVIFICQALFIADFVDFTSIELVMMAGKFTAKTAITANHVEPVAETSTRGR
jgi:hypothetical protein